MSQRASKLDNANVLAGFDSQLDADGAVLGLRIAGFSDDRIGYLARTPGGRVTDLLTRRHRFVAAILGGVFGALIGAWAGPPFVRLWAGWEPQVDPLGMTATCAIIGALCFGAVGGMVGLWPDRTQPSGPVPGGGEPLVIAVDAGEKREEARQVLRHHGGHELSGGTRSDSH